MTTEQKKAIDDVIAKFDEGIKRLEQMDASESILFNPISELGLKINEDGTVQACGIEFATRFTYEDRTNKIHPALRRLYRDGTGNSFLLYGMKLARDLVIAEMRKTRESMAGDLTNFVIENAA